MNTKMSQIELPSTDLEDDENNTDTTPSRNHSSSIPRRLHQNNFTRLSDLPPLPSSSSAAASLVQPNLFTTSTTRRVILRNANSGIDVSSVGITFEGFTDNERHENVENESNQAHAAATSTEYTELSLHDLMNASRLADPSIYNLLGDNFEELLDNDEEYDTIISRSAHFQSLGVHQPTNTDPQIRNRVLTIPRPAEMVADDGGNQPERVADEELSRIEDQIRAISDQLQEDRMRLLGVLREFYTTPANQETRNPPINNDRISVAISTLEHEIGGMESRTDANGDPIQEEDGAEGDIEDESDWLQSWYTTNDNHASEIVELPPLPNDPGYYMQRVEEGILRTEESEDSTSQFESSPGDTPQLQPVTRRRRHRRNHHRIVHRRPRNVVYPENIPIEYQQFAHTVHIDPYGQLYVVIENSEEVSSEPDLIDGDELLGIGQTSRYGPNEYIDDLTMAQYAGSGLPRISRGRRPREDEIHIPSSGHLRLTNPGPQRDIFHPSRIHLSASNTYSNLPSVGLDSFRRATREHISAALYFNSLLHADEEAIASYYLDANGDQCKSFSECFENAVGWDDGNGSFHDSNHAYFDRNGDLLEDTDDDSLMEHFSRANHIDEEVETESAMPALNPSSPRKSGGVDR